MIMTLTEFFAMPDGMDVEEWDAELKRRDRIRKRIAKLNDDIDSEVDALEVLKDEIGSDKWMKRNNRLCNLTVKRDNLMKEMEGWK